MGAGEGVGAERKAMQPGHQRIGEMTSHAGELTDGVLRAESTLEHYAGFSTGQCCLIHFTPAPGRLAMHTP